MKLNELNIPRSELEHLIDEWIWIVRNKSILIKKLEGSTYEELAEEYHLSVQRIKEIVRDAQNLILEHTQ